MTPSLKRNLRVRKQASERSGAREQSEYCGASERVSGASERVNGRASGSVLQSVFLVILAHGGEEEEEEEDEEGNDRDIYGARLSYCF